MKFPVRRRRAIQTVPASAAVADPTVASGPGPKAVSRRQVLGRGAVVAGAAAAGAGAGLVSAAAPAGALNGSTLVVGNSGNNATNPTVLTGSQFQVVDPVGGSCFLADNTKQQAYGYWAKVDGAGSIGVQSEATGQQSYGVRGTTVGGTFGVIGSADGHGAGVGAYSDTGPAVFAYATGGGPALRLYSAGGSMPPTTGDWSLGDVTMNEQGLWLCLKGGTGSASTWVKLSRVFQPLNAPVRVYDSRAGYAPNNVAKGKLTNAEERVIDLSLGGAIPKGLASAVLVNVTVAATDADGWMALYKNGIPWPGTSTINWSKAGSAIANAATVTVDAAGRAKVRCSGSAELIIDVVGYYT